MGWEAGREGGRGWRGIGGMEGGREEGGRKEDGREEGKGGSVHVICIHV